MDSQTASLFLDGLVDQATTTDDYAFVSTLHVLRQACEKSNADPAKIGMLCRAAEYISEARIDAEQPRSAPGAFVRLRSRLS